jgi:GNAT superfamily N-acetyltransferase
VETVRPADARAFLELAGPLLAGDPIVEARNNLILGIAGTLIDRPETYPTSHLWIVLDGGPVAAALVTPPFNLVLADPVNDDALGALLDAVREDGAPVPGIVGNVPHVHAAVEAWVAATGTRARPVRSQGVHALTRVHELPRAPGRSRAATRADRDLLVSWFVAFNAEALPEQGLDPETLRRMVDSRLTSEDAGLWFWEERKPVSLAGYGGRTPSGVRVGPVYTPPEHRRRGYATSLVAELSVWLLRRHRACFLHTDLANATSNRIYAGIGYERVCDSVEFRFTS